MSIKGCFPRISSAIRWPCSTLRWAAIMYSAAVGQSAWAISAPRRGYEAVYDNRLLQRGGAQDQPRDPADLEAADLGQDVQSILRIRPVDPQAFFDDADLVCELLIVDPGAVAGHLRCRMAAEGGDDRAARRRVPDPHIPGAEEIDRLRGHPGDIDAGFNGANGLPHGSSPAPSAMFFVPGPIRRERIFPEAASPLMSPATPMSTTVTVAPTWRASALIPAPPATKL